MKFLKTLSLFALTLVLLVGCWGSKKEEESPPPQNLDVKSAIFSTINEVDSVANSLMDNFNDFITNNIDEVSHEDVYHQQVQITASNKGITDDAITPLLLNTMPLNIFEYLIKVGNAQEGVFYQSEYDLLSFFDDFMDEIPSDENDEINIFINFRYYILDEVIYLQFTSMDGAEVLSADFIKIEYDWTDKKPKTITLYQYHTIDYLEEIDCWELQITKIDCLQQSLEIKTLRYMNQSYEDFLADGENLEENIKDNVMGISSAYTNYGTVYDFEKGVEVCEISIYDRESFFTNDNEEYVNYLYSNVEEMDLVAYTTLVAGSEETRTVESAVMMDGVLYSHNRVRMQNFYNDDSEVLGGSIFIRSIEQLNFLLTELYHNKFITLKDKCNTFEKKYEDFLVNVDFTQNHIEQIDSDIDPHKWYYNTLSEIDVHGGQPIEYKDYKFAYYNNAIVVVQENDDYLLYVNINFHPVWNENDTLWHGGKVDYEVEYREYYISKKDSVSKYEYFYFGLDEYEYHTFEFDTGYDDFIIDFGFQLDFSAIISAEKLMVSDTDLQNYLYTKTPEGEEYTLYHEELDEITFTTHEDGEEVEMLIKAEVEDMISSANWENWEGVLSLVIAEEVSTVFYMIMLMNGIFA